MEKDRSAESFSNESRLSKPQISENEQNDYNDTDNIKYVSSEHFFLRNVFGLQGLSTTRLYDFDPTASPDGFAWRGPRRLPS